MFRFDELIPTIDELKRRTHREAAIKPSEESKAKMVEIFNEFGYTTDNANVYNSLVGFGALLFDGTARKGLILSGNVGIGKTLGVQIIANKFRIPVLYPKAFASIYKELNAGPMAFEKFVMTANDFHEEPKTIVIDELGQKDTAKHYGEALDIMVDVLEIRYPISTLRSRMLKTIPDFHLVNKER